MNKGQKLILSAVLIVLLFVNLPFVSACAKPVPQVAVHEYIIPTYADVTGPYSELQPIISPSKTLVFDWWNENVGKKLGVKLVSKTYDNRYDTAESASIHARAVVNDKPIAILTEGAPGVLPIIMKVEEQKIVVIHGSPGSGFFNVTEGFVFCPLRDWATLATGSFEWFCEDYWKKPQKPRVVLTIFEGVAGKDIATPILMWEKTYPKAEYAFNGEVQWHPANPVDLSGLVRKIVEEGKPDLISFAGTAVGSAAFYSAMQELGYLHKVPILNPPNVSLTALSEMLGADKLEGDFEYNGINYSPGTEAEKIFMNNINKYRPGTPWGGIGSQFSFQVYLLTRAVERAVANVGSDNLTGQALYDVLNKGEFKADELYGLTGDIKFNPQDRLAGIRTVYVYQMKDGKPQMVGQHALSDVTLSLKKW